MSSHASMMSHQSETPSRRIHRGGHHELFESDSELGQMGVERLLEIVTNLRTEIAYVKIENDLFERFLEKNAPQMLLGITKLMLMGNMNKPKITFKIDPSSAGTVVTAGGINENSGRSGGGRRSVNRDNTDTVSMLTIKTITSNSQSHMSLFSESRPDEFRINYIFRIEMCNKDADIFNGQLQKFRQLTLTSLRSRAALIESLRIDRAESIKTICEFRHFMHETGKRKFGQEVPSEHLLTFIDTWINNGNAMVEQMRLRTATLQRSQKQKHQALATKKELSGILRPIDFEQLQIEKIQLTKEFEEKQSHFIGLKRLASEVTQAMITRKNLLEKAEEKLLSLQTQINNRLEGKQRFWDLNEKVYAECEDWENAVHKLKQRKSTHRVPSVEDYIASKSRGRALDREWKFLQRTLNISVIQLRGIRSQLAQAIALREQTARKRATSKARFDAIKDVIGQT